MGSYRFGTIEVRPAERRVLVAGAPAALGARAFDLLLALIEHRDRVVTKDELLHLVWPGVVVEENNLQVQVSTLRKILGNHSIATLPGRGYRFTLSPEGDGAAPPAAVPRHNLPAELNTFVGREAETVHLRELLRSSRLVTMTGAGGTGKSRLSIHVAAAMLAQLPDGAWRVELAAVSGDSHVTLAIASTLGVPETELLERVAGCRMLLILDNCEHLLQACAEAARRMLEASGGMRILATSREPLHVAGEATFRLQPLPGPHAIQLFAERARAADPDSDPGLEGSPAVAEICRRLDGMPLAIELAAARVRALPVAKIAARLDDRFRLLTRGDSTSMPHQQTLRASMDWSYELLSEGERALLRRLSVFAGGWTLEAAEEVCASELQTRSRILELLVNLVEKSLVMLEGDRYHLLETVREYAREQLEASGEALEAHDEHVQYYLRFTSRAHREIIGPDQAAWMAQVDAERENIFAAQAYCHSIPGAEDLELRLVSSIKAYWISRGAIGAARAVVMTALPRIAPGTRSMSRALYDAGQLGYHMGLHREARVQLEESLALSRERGDRIAMGQVLQPLGATCMAQGDLAAARGYLAEALEIAREQNDPRNVLAAITVLAQLLHVEGDVAGAEPLYEEVLGRARENKDPESVAIALLNLAMTAIHREQPARARTLLREALELALQTGSRPVRQAVLDICSGLASLERAWDHAARLHGAAEAEAKRTGLQRDPADAAFLAPRIGAARAAAGGPAFEKLIAEGRQLSGEDALESARAWLA
jgi:non-specific serine/threonine protein kinase